MKLTVGFILYNNSTADYLPYFLPSLFNQSFNDFSAVAVDNSTNNESLNLDFINNKYPQIKILQKGKTWALEKLLI
jgi:glycosyltransferase involved in cell wall biosynthesis